MVFDLNEIIYIGLGLILALVLIIWFVRAKFKGSTKNQIYIGNLPYRVNEYDLKKYFRQFGNVKEAYVVKHPRTRRSKGYAFVTFSKSQDAAKSLSAHGKRMNGRTLVVRIAKPRTSD